MDEYISREAVNALIEAECSPKVAAFLNHAIDNIPAADVRPVVRGKWSTVYDDFMKSHYDTCSCCGKEYFGANGFNFCPDCGADMREVDDGN